MARRRANPPYMFTESDRALFARFGSVRQCDTYHFQIRDEDGCLLADWWPHVHKFRIEENPTQLGGIDVFIAALVYEYPEFETKDEVNE